MDITIYQKKQDKPHKKQDKPHKIQNKLHGKYNTRKTVLEQGDCTCHRPCGKQHPESAQLSQHPQAAGRGQCEYHVDEAGAPCRRPRTRTHGWPSQPRGSLVAVDPGATPTRLRVHRRWPVDRQFLGRHHVLAWCISNVWLPSVLLRMIRQRAIGLQCRITKTNSECHDRS
jgi:hypothetical protein